MSVVARLADLVPPPARSEVVTVDHAAAERLLGRRFPDDFLEIVRTYGPGTFDDFLWVLQPSSANLHLDLVEQANVQLGALRDLQSQGEDVPYLIGLPDPELLPWAITDNGDVCYWVTTPLEDPDAWSVVVNESRGPTWESFSGSASEFLEAVLSGARRLDIFPDDFPSPEPSFHALST